MNGRRFKPDLFGQKLIPTSDVHALALALMNRKDSSDPTTQADINSFLLNAAATDSNQMNAVAEVMIFLEKYGKKSPQDVVTEKLAKDGYKFKPRTSSEPIQDISFAFESYEVDGEIKYRPQGSINLREHFTYLTKINDWAADKELPKELIPKNVAYKVFGTTDAFGQFYRSIPGKSNARGVLGTNYYGATVSGGPRTVFGSLSERKTVIAINDSLARTGLPDFGPNSTLLEETIYHEFAHTLHNTMGFDWGLKGALKLNPKSKEYSKIYRDQYITKYGQSDYQEHFAETFAKLLSTGEATPEFLDFLEKQVGIKPFSIDGPISGVMRNSKSFTDAYVGKIQQSLGPDYVVSIKPPRVSLEDSDFDLTDPADAKLAYSLGQEVDFHGAIETPDGKLVGTFHRIIKLGGGVEPRNEVYHSTFSIQPEYQGQGIGTKFLNASEEFYRENSIPRIKLTAGLDNGPYAWAVSGFDFASNRDRLKATSYLGKYGEIAKLLLPRGSEIEKLADANYADQMKELDSILNSLDIPPGMNRREVRDMLAQWAQNGWTLTEEDINDMLEKSKMPDLLPIDIAMIGRRSKRATPTPSLLGVKPSSFGRWLFMEKIGSWDGVKDL